MFKMNQKGFTFIEVLMVITIISIMTAILSRSFENNKTLIFGLKQFITDVRITQNNALGVLQHDGSIPEGGYGIRISTASSGSYILFADDGDHIFDGGAEIISTEDLPPNVIINSVTTTPADVGSGTVDIIFASPYGEVFVNTESTSTKREVIKVEIEICNSSSLCRTFIVNSEGLIGE